MKASEEKKEVEKKSKQQEKEIKELGAQAENLKESLRHEREKF